jgi:paraquat-inducible protein A
MGGAHPNSLAARARGPDRLLGWLTLLAGLLLALGWTLPIMTVEKLWFLSERVSILQGAGELWHHGDYFLFAVILVFSVIFPLLKLGLALYFWYQADSRGAALGRALGWIEQLGRWAMLDVFVVALLVVAIQASLISEVAMHSGIYVFTAAVLVSILTVQRMARLARQAQAAHEN